MRMDEIKVGMHLKPKTGNGNTILVTEITDHGFKYSIHPDEEIIHLLPVRYGKCTLRDGHEHFGFNGEAFFEPVLTHEAVK